MGSIQVWFPDSGPANIRRAFVSLGRLAPSPFSVYGGSEPSTDASIARFDLLLASEAYPSQAASSRPYFLTLWYLGSGSCC